MIARITRILLLVQLIVALLLAWLFARHWPQLPVALTMLLGVGSVLLVRAAIVANNFRVAARFAGEQPPGTATWPKLLRMFWGELCATLVSSSWHMPFCRLGAVPELHGSGIPVLLVHGYGCNSGYWRPMARAFRAAGIRFSAVDLEPVLGDIDDYLPRIGGAVDALCAAAGTTQIVIVAHSMGGLVARAWLHGNGWQQIAALITLGTPHQGTALAAMGIGRNAAQMRRIDHPAGAARNPWLVRLNDTPREPRDRIVSIYSTYDNIVVPATSGALADATNNAFACIGHVALASHAPLIACVIEHIRHYDRPVAGDVPGSPAGGSPDDAAAADMRMPQSMSIQEKPSS